MSITNADQTFYASNLAKASVFFFVIITFSSCFSAKKMDKWINQQYEGLPLNKLKNSDEISIKVANASANDRISSTVRSKTKVIPALLYWHWELANTSTLHHAVPATNLSSGIISYANSKGIKQKLNGRKVELTINKMPVDFSMTDKGNLIYVLVYYIGWENIYIEPSQQDLVVSYKFIKDNREAKAGTITVANRDRPIALKAFQSTRKMTLNYLEQYEANIKTMGKELVDKLMLEM
jgi:hypothetical protein